MYETALQKNSMTAEIIPAAQSQQHARSFYCLCFYQTVCQAQATRLSVRLKHVKDSNWLLYCILPIVQEFPQTAHPTLPTDKMPGNLEGGGVSFRSLATVQWYKANSLFDPCSLPGWGFPNTASSGTWQLEKSSNESEASMIGALAP